MDLTTMDLRSVLKLVKTGQITSVELTNACLDKARATTYLNAYTFINKETAIQNASFVDKKIKLHKHTGILSGVPIAIKDNFSTIGMPTSCASNMLKGHIYDMDATAVKKLKEQDAVIIGKTNMDEFAMGNGSDTSAFGKVRNPIDTDLTPGGSSGGSAVAVAVGSSFASLGTDTGGSVRQPAAYCGITGLKPTFGRVSRHGVFPLAHSLDHVGCLTKTVKDNLLVFETIYGVDELDKPTIRQENTNFDTHCLEYTNKLLRVGVLKQSFNVLVDEDVKACVSKAADFFTNE
ncbi:MAG: amidase, partial [Clostridia bacterium]